MDIKQWHLHDIQTLPGPVNDFVHEKLSLFLSFFSEKNFYKKFIILLNK